MTEPRERTVARAPVLWRRTSRTLVVATPAGDIIEVTGMPAVLWDSLDSPTPVAEIVDDVAEAFGVTRAAAAAALEEALSMLAEHGVVELP